MPRGGEQATDKIEEVRNRITKLYGDCGYDVAGDFCLYAAVVAHMFGNPGILKDIVSILNEVGADPREVEDYIREHGLGKDPECGCGYDPKRFSIDVENDWFGTCIMLSGFLEAVEAVLAK